MRSLYFETLLIALAVLLLEVSYTRVFSFKLVYYFAYLVIGIAMLGLGAGGVFVAIFSRLRRIPIERLIPWCGIAAAATVALGYFLVAYLRLNLFELIIGAAQGKGIGALAEALKLVAICLALLAPFLLAGIVLATIFATRTERINRLYFADLAGAGLGCALCIPLMVVLSPPGTVWLAGALFAVASVPLAARAGSRLFVASLCVAGVLLAGALAPSRLPDPVPDRFKVDTTQAVFSSWSPVFRVDVLPPWAGGPSMFLVHDGLLGSSIRKFDGDFGAYESFEHTDRSVPFDMIATAPKVAIIGSAGGHEILVSLYFHASHITAVELNPVTVELLRGRFADYTGRIALHPNVDLVNAEGRTFLESSPERYDLIWFVAPDSYAAMNAATSGAFVLAESYLYTVEMLAEAFEHLTPDGVICAQFGEIDFSNRPNRTTRYVATAREALRRLGIRDVERHVLLNTGPSFGQMRVSTILVRKTPFTEAEVARFEAATAAIPGARLEFAWTTGGSGQPFAQVLTVPDAELAAWYAHHPFVVGAIDDDSPFFWHFVRFRDAAFSLEGNVEEGFGERVLMLLVGVATLLAALFMLAPLLVIRDTWRAIPHKTHAGIYFAALGLGFMFIEVSLIQRFTLLLGYPTHSLTVTLFALLLSTGIGSLASERWAGRWRGALLGYGATLAVLVLLYALTLTPIVRHGIGWPFALRVAVTVALLTPLGLCLGAFMPLGLRAIAALTVHREAFVAWAWAANGFFSVMSSVLATILSMTIGFTWVLVSGAALYAVGIAALLRIPAINPPMASTARRGVS